MRGESHHRVREGAGTGRAGAVPTRCLRAGTWACHGHKWPPSPSERQGAGGTFPIVCFFYARMPVGLSRPEAGGQGGRGLHLRGWPPWMRSEVPGHGGWAVCAAGACAAGASSWRPAPATSGLAVPGVPSWDSPLSSLFAFWWHFFLGGKWMFLNAKLSCRFSDGSRVRGQRRREGHLKLGQVMGEGLPAENTDSGRGEDHRPHVSWVPRGGEDKLQKVPER